jgi:hypothetical protein
VRSEAGIAVIWAPYIGFIGLMISLDDPRWPTLLGGYRIPYDASNVLRRMEDGENVWEELWNELHHQGDLGEASYAAVPHLVRICDARGTDWNLYAIAAIIEVERHRTSNPPIPAWLAESYSEAWTKLAVFALGDLAGTPDKYTLRSALSVVALARGDLKLGALLVEIDESEISEYVEDRMAWSQLYATRHD